MNIWSIACVLFVQDLSYFVFRLNIKRRRTFFYLISEAKLKLKLFDSRHKQTNCGNIERSI